VRGGGIFIGPNPDNIRTFGLKHSARALARAPWRAAGAGHRTASDEDEAVAAAREIGYPVMLKATAGGGGIGMRVCEDDDAVRQGFAAVALGEGNFGDAGVFLESYVGRARHVEVQIFGDGAGRSWRWASATVLPAPQPEGGGRSPRPTCPPACAPN
jgi:urea carboxylase